VRRGGGEGGEGGGGGGHRPTVSVVVVAALLMRQRGSAGGGLKQQGMEMLGMGCCAAWGLRGRPNEATGSVVMSPLCAKGKRGRVQLGLLVCLE